MSSYKLSYFDWVGYGEICRYMFALADVQYEDYRIPRDDYFPLLPPEIKSSLTWGQLPTLEVDGVLIAHKGAIFRFLARRFNMYGKNEFEAAKCDEIYEAWRDCQMELGKFSKDPRKAVMEGIIKDDLPKFFSKFDQLIYENGGKYFVGNSYTFADITVFHSVLYFEIFSELDLTTPYPNLKGAINTFLQHPKIAEWIKKRPIHPPYNVQMHMDFLKRTKI